MKGWFSKKIDEKFLTSPIGVSLFVVGAISSAFQLLLLKEIINIAGGYELITGVFMGTWLLSSSIGSWIGGKTKKIRIDWINLIFTFGPLISLLVLFSAILIHDQPGVTIGFYWSILFTFLVTAPICLASGFSFIKLNELTVLEHRKIPGKSFAMETTGGIISCILISVVSSGFINTYLLIFVFLLLSLSYSLLNFFIFNETRKNIFKVTAILVLIAIVFINPDILAREILIDGSEITKTKDTHFGNISISDKNGEKTLFYDYRIASYSDDIIGREEDIHFALLQRESIGDVLLISGSLYPRLKELDKYRLESVTYFERDPWLLKLEGEELPGVSFKLSINHSDAFSSLKKGNSMYDAVLLLVPPPSTLSLNRFYTTDFYKVAKKRMNTDGVLLCSPGPSENYLGNEAISLYSSIYNSLSDVFANVKPVMGDKIYFIASDGPLSVNFAEMAEARGLQNYYVNRNYIADDLTDKKSKEILELINVKAKANTISNPVACFFLQKYNLSKDTNKTTLTIVVVVLLFASTLFLFKRSNIPMYFCAAALSGYEIIALFLLQVTAGNMYRLSGLVIAMVMAGLAIGASVGIKKLENKKIGSLLPYLSLYYLVIGTLLIPVISIVPMPNATLFIILTTLVPALITGQVFRKLTFNNGIGPSTSKVYSADLAGSAIGFVVVGTVLVPLLGLRFSIFILAALVLFGWFFGKNKK